MAIVSGLQDDANRKTLIKTYPVESLLDLWQAGHGRAVLLKEAPADTLHFTREPFAGVAEQRYICSHTRTYSIEQILPEVGEHVPGVIVHKSQHRLTAVGILAAGNVEICNVTIEWGPYKAIIIIELSVIDLLRGRTYSLVHVTQDAQSI